MKTSFNKRKKGEGFNNNSFIKRPQRLTLEKTKDHTISNTNRTKNNLIKKNMPFNGNKISNNKPNDIKKLLEKQNNNNNKPIKQLKFLNTNHKINKLYQTISNSKDKKFKKKITKLPNNNNDKNNNSNYMIKIKTKTNIKTRMYTISNPISFSICSYSTKIYDKGKGKYKDKKKFNNSNYKSREKSSDILREKSRDKSRDKLRNKSRDILRIKSKDISREKFRNKSRDLLREKSRDKSRDKSDVSSIDIKKTKSKNYKYNSNCITQRQHKSIAIIKKKNIDYISKNIRNISKISKNSNVTSDKKEKNIKTEKKKESKNNRNNDIKKNRNNVNDKNEKRHSISSKYDLYTDRKPAPSSSEKVQVYINNIFNTYIKFNNNKINKDYLLTESTMSKNERNSLNISYTQNNISVKTQSSKSKSKDRMIKKYDYNHLLYKTELNLNNEKNKKLIETRRNSVLKKRDSSTGESIMEYKYDYISPLNVHRKIFSFKKNEIIDIKNINNYIVIVKKKCDSSLNKKRVYFDSFYKERYMEKNNNNYSSDYDTFYKNILINDYSINARTQRNIVFYCDKIKQMNVLIKPRNNLKLRFYRHSKRNSVI